MPDGTSEQHAFASLARPPRANLASEVLVQPIMGESTRRKPYSPTHLQPTKQDQEGIGIEWVEAELL